LGTAYSFQPQASGGHQPYTWTITGLPRSFSYSTFTGAFGGTPTSPGTYLLNISVSDSSSPQQTVSATLPFVVASTALAITSPPILPDATVGQFYLYQIATTGGQLPYNWYPANMPSWLIWDVFGSTCGTPRSVCGTPLSLGTSSFTMTVIDSSNPTQTVSQAFSLTVDPIRGR
jgi:hypothetical protein